MYAAPRGSQMPFTPTAMPQTRIRHARVHGRFLETTRSPDFQAITIAAIEMRPEKMFSRDHGHGPTTTCTGHIMLGRSVSVEYPIGSYGVQRSAMQKVTTGPVVVVVGEPTVVVVAAAAVVVGTAK
jgi:hypothetical protein